MVASLQPVVDGEYPSLTAGTIEKLAQILFEELQMSGYSILIDDVQAAIVCQTRYYAGWAALEVQYSATAAMNLDISLPIAAYEWSFIEPVVRAHCALLQAQRVEGSSSLGGERFGLTESEARTLYNEAREKLPKDAFVAAPFSIDTGLGDQYVTQNGYFWVGGFWP